MLNGSVNRESSLKLINPKIVIMNLASIICIILGICFFVGTYFTIKRKLKFITNAEIVNGKVVELVQSSSSSLSSSSSSSSNSFSQGASNNKLMYAPVVSFKSKSGNQYRFESSQASNPPSYSVGETVEVIYNPSNPCNASINDFFSRWFLSLLLGFFTVISFVVGVCLWFVC